MFWVRMGRVSAAVGMIVFVLPISCGKKPPPNGPTPTTGSIYVKSVPTNCKVYLEDQAKGSTPLTIPNLSAGVHHLRTEKKNYDTHLDTATVTVGETDTVSVVMQYRSAQLVITSEPSEAVIALDGVTYSNRATPDSFRVEANYQHTITLRKQWYLDWTTHTTPLPFRADSVHALLTLRTDAPGHIAVTSNPSHATIYLDGGNTGRLTPDTLKNVSTGQHTIRVRLTGYHEATGNVTVLAGQTVAIHLEPSMIFGRLQVQSVPDHAYIHLDGTYSGRVTPALFDSMAVRTYSVRLTMPNRNAWASSASVLDGQTASVTGTLSVKCPGDSVVGDLRLPPEIHIVGLTAGSGTVRGTMANADVTQVRVVLYALTNSWYVQPYTASPYTYICGDGTWSNGTHPWKRMVAVLVDRSYVPQNIMYTHPALDPGVLAYDEYPVPEQRQPLRFSGYDWGMKVSEDRFDPGPNYWTDKLANVWVDGSGQLHLRISSDGGRSLCPEVHLTRSLGHGTYTVQLASAVDQLDPRTVFSPFIYASPSREFDVEHSPALVPAPNNSQYVIQPYNIAGNRVFFTMPNVSTSTHRIVWRADRVEFTSWKGWAAYPPDPVDVITTWTYTGSKNFTPGDERFRFNLWLFGGQPLQTRSSEEIVVHSFRFDSP